MFRAQSHMLLLFVVVTAQVLCWFIIPCWPLVTDRIDPIVSPGRVASHVHQIVGGGGISPNMTYDDTQRAACTTCFVKGDRSNYWMPALYYRHMNGSFDRVPQLGSTSVYYLNERSRVPADEVVETMPRGLRMVAGDPLRRAFGGTTADHAISYTCLNYTGSPTPSHGFPAMSCPDGLRAEVTFPSCWNGRDLDSPDHESHVSYPASAFASGPCPAAFPHRLVTLRVEFIFDTNQYAEMWWTDLQPFVWSHGDATGFGLHADYLMGWPYDLLSSAVDTCDDTAGMIEHCEPFSDQIQTAYVNPGWCHVQPFVDEYIGGVVDVLPGHNPVQIGP